eukprot:m.259256 g.259256  ORF g.259256 m.259256 type:complete len:68 (+) comp19660_c0_seq5:2780-2983(+)
MLKQRLGDVELTHFESSSTKKTQVTKYWEAVLQVDPARRAKLIHLCPYSIFDIGQGRHQKANGKKKW